VALRSQVIDFIGLHRLEDPQHAGGIGHVAVMQDEAAASDVRILVQVIDALGVEERRAPLHAMDDVSLVEQELGQIRAVLAGDSSNQCGAAHQLGGGALGSSISAPPRNS
jgi:hypothetical protein